MKKSRVSLERYKDDEGHLNAEAVDLVVVSIGEGVDDEPDIKGDDKHAEGSQDQADEPNDEVSGFSLEIGQQSLRRRNSGFSTRLLIVYVLFLLLDQSVF